MAAEPFSRLSVNISPDQMRRLKQRSTETGEPISEIVRRAIDKEIGE